MRKIRYQAQNESRVNHVDQSPFLDSTVGILGGRRRKENRDEIVGNGAPRTDGHSRIEAIPHFVP